MVEIGPAHTIFLPYEGNLVAFANSFGFFDTGDVDANGRNIFHLIMGAMKYCSPAASSATTMFLPGYPKLAGDYAAALRQQTTHGTPHHVTPLKLLCQDSDKHLLAHDVVKSILDHHILDVSAFAEPDGPKASVFFLFCLGGGEMGGYAIESALCLVPKAKASLGTNGERWRGCEGSGGNVGGCLRKRLSSGRRRRAGRRHA